MHFNSSEEAVAFGTFAAKKTRTASLRMMGISTKQWKRLFRHSFAEKRFVLE
jgi:hypothetical protein